ncbi:uncharacterized protein LOC108600995 [Drosophila busckii]|uniref:uncharacterized protein LOC108600995 n=1 Tax=Drosophila busckii TaxID=30019 RepID=UPI001432F9BD|nr:uncharacterized protein LOC108600995 [Drosophila busckii]
MPCEENAKTSSDIEHVDWSHGGSGQHYANVRFGSGSSQASQNSGDICRICHCESDPQNPLLTPCYCSGSLKYVHQACLQQWLTASATNSCELCKFPFIMHTKIKPFNEWRSLGISSIERRRLCCTVLFHCAAAVCVIWSLCVLIERAADDVKRGLIDWPFWTKLAVVTVGLTGGIVFMYIQCKPTFIINAKARNSCVGLQQRCEIPTATCAQQVGHQVGQVAVAANIECSQSQHNYERDWALDDVVSQISSFRPCPQGSGSMTPFHDSIHNVLEHSESSSRGSANDLCAGSRQDLSASGISTDTGRDNAMQGSYSGSGEHKAPSISSGVSHAVANGLGGFVYKPHQSKRYSNSSIFMENRDILNDSPLCVGLATPSTYDYSTPPKIDYRLEQLDCCAPFTRDTELRRYSSDSKQHKVDTVLDMELPASPLAPPTAYASQQQQQHQHLLRRSFEQSVGDGTAELQMQRRHLCFKSLPNLSSSCESLLQK